MFMLFKKEKTNGKIFAGEIVVVPGSGLKKFVSTLTPSFERQTEDIVEKTLCQLLDLPAKTSRQQQVETDMALDVIVPEYNFGELLLCEVGLFTIPFVWRPSITVTGRLYAIDSGKTVYAATVKHSPSWLSWGRKTLSFSKLMGIQANMSDADMERMTTEAIVELLSKVIKKS